MEKEKGKIKAERKDITIRVIAALLVLLVAGILACRIYKNSSLAPETETEEKSEVLQTGKSEVPAETTVQSPGGNKTGQQTDTEKEDKTAGTTSAPAAASDAGKKPAGQSSPASSESSSSAAASSDSSSTSSRKGHYEERQVLVKEAYDERVLIRKGACRDVLVQAAYDSEEMVYGEGAYYGADMTEVYVCNGCGAIFYDSGINDHIGTPEHPGWHNDYVATGDPYWHNVSYQTIHHDAVYRSECEPDEYETVHHDAEYRIEKVWVED